MTEAQTSPPHGAEHATLEGAAKSACPVDAGAATVVIA